MMTAGLGDGPQPDQRDAASMCLESLLADVLDATMMLQRADFGDVRLYDEATATLKIAAYRGLGPEFLEHFAIVDASDTSACGLALKAGKRVIVEDVANDPDSGPHRAIAALTGYRGILCTPLVERGSGKPLGMLSTHFREPCRPTEQNLQLTDIFARQAADAIGARLVEQRLRESEGYFRLALEAGDMGTWEWNPATQLVKADKAHQALFGLPPRDEPRAVADYWTRIDEDERIGRQRAGDALAAGTDMELELRIRPSAEAVRWISIRGRPREGGSGAINGISYDITERKNREEALRKHQEWLTAILDQVPGAVGLFDKEGDLLLRGGPLGHLLDEIIPSRDHASGGRWWTFDAQGQPLPPAEYPPQRALRGENVSPGIDFLHSPGQGSKTWYRVSAAPFRDQAGEIGGAVVMLQDVDKEKRAERELRRSEARLKAAVDLVNLGLYSWNPRTGELVLDKAVKAMCGLPQEAPITYDTWREAVHPDDLERVEAAIADSGDPGRDGGYDVEYRLIGIKDGVERWIATRGRAYFEGGTAVSFQGVALDVTDHKRTESALERRVEARTRELEESNTALIAEISERRQIGERLNKIQAELFHASRLSVAGQMAAVIAHEISQPLTATLNSVNAARRLLTSGDPGRDVALRELIEDAGREIDRASEIVRRLRSSIRRGSVDRVAEAVAPMIEEAVAFAAVGPNALGVSISQYFDPLAPIALVDRVQIQQVISNLVRNALEAMESQARRELTVTSEACGDGYLRLIVSDSGPGVADTIIPTLFEPILTTKAGGMGLGLSICKSIVEAHGGRIAYAHSLDGGAAFQFTLQTPAGTAEA